MFYEQQFSAHLVPRSPQEIHHKQAVQREFLSPSHDILFPKGYSDLRREQTIIQSNRSEDSAYCGQYPSQSPVSMGLPSTGCTRQCEMGFAARP